MKSGDYTPRSRIRRLSAPDAAVQQKAAEWLALREAREFTAAEEAAFAEWCAIDQRHRAIFSEVEAAWHTFDRLAAYPHSIDRAADPDLLAPTRRSRTTQTIWPALAAAACIGLIAAAWFRPWASFPVESAKDIPVIGQASPHVLHLSDGSDVELNTGSDVVEMFTPTKRRVRLVRGEAHFTVTKNLDRPFIVEAGGVAVRAVGTAFNVRVDATAVEILVTEGQVQVSPPRPSADAPAASATVVSPTGASPESMAVLGIGQRVIVPTVASAQVPTPVVETLAAPTIDRVLAWQTSRLVFDATALSDVVAQFNRRTESRATAPRLSVRDPGLAAMRISGRIRADNIENFVEVLEANFGVVAERRSDGEIVLRRR